ncbi:MAG: VWA domain-containing protein [Myxococcota bacterium]|nr:VWA domain-containing protein [Myxococcota bacterium]
MSIRIALLAIAWLASVGASAEVRVVIDSPAPGQTLEDHVHQARIEGRASAETEAPDVFDVMLVLDVSHSTRAASGSDVDGDGTIGLNPRHELLPPGAVAGDTLSTDPQDSILYAEMLAARTLLEGLDPNRVRVGLISFAGEVNPITGRRLRIDQEDAWLEMPLTSDYDAVRARLDSILARGASGATNFSAGVRLAIRELAGLSGARSMPRPGARRVVLFLTDGLPTLPAGKGNESDPGDKEAAIRAAELARKAGITVNTYALGHGALQYPKTVTEMARLTLGTFTPIQKPGDIIMVLRGVSFADVEDVVVTNLTTGDFSTDVSLNPDGSFTGFVPVREGKNRVRVSALASDGSKGAAEFDLLFDHQQFGGRAPMAELERIREQNKQLEIHRLEMDIEAFREQQRKELLLRAEPRSDPEGGVGDRTEAP